jgi:hypothetical protein
MTFRKRIRKNKFSKKDFHTLQGTMSHRPLTNTSSLNHCSLMGSPWPPIRAYASQANGQSGTGQFSWQQLLLNFDPSVN